MARLVRDSLRERGFVVFMDVENLKSGQFNEALLGEIESATDVVAILTPGSMERCLQEGDWLRWEIGHAISCDKNIVPVITKGFSWPLQPLPEDLNRLPYYQAVEPSHNFFEASIDKLVKLLCGRPKLISTATKRLLITICVATLLLSLTLYATRRTNTETNQNEILGRELCFQQDNWQQGVTLLAEGGVLYKEAASAELAFPAKVNEVEIARLWVTAGSRALLPDKWHCYRRTRHWFRIALENPELKTSITSIAAEMARVPTLRGRLRFKGESYFKEQIVVGPAAIRWASQSGAGPYEIIGTKTNLPAFTFDYGKANFRVFRTTDVLPEGIDFRTARVANSQFGGKTGAHAFQKLESAPTGRGIVLRIEEDNPRGAGYEPVKAAFDSSSRVISEFTGILKETFGSDNVLCAQDRR